MVVGFYFPATSAMDSEFSLVIIFWNGVTQEVSRIFGWKLIPYFSTAWYKDSRLELIHVWREKNHVADWVAKTGLTEQQTFSWRPGEMNGRLRTLCNLESRGVPNIRG
ncbi:hypothetical protein LIER_28934 [Lithospermum erythrorhizon]|uniref:RNase H type-1 domain-containing protein n=1 Tax=Lithospermum erythrorhizon TaxID=34254 RepID=A0AAV3RKR3_LITER